jgi:uncharacterized protein (TIGR03067 family)
MRRRYLAILAMVGSLAGCGSNKETPKETPAAKKEDKELLQGTWVIASEEHEGRADKMNVGAAITFVGDEVLFNESAAHIGREHTGRFRLDPGKNPNELDIMRTEEGKEDNMVAIYRLEGDTLTICGTHVKGLPRPSTFAAPAGSKMSLLTLKRTK